MELNRENIIKALECCASRSLADCHSCPYEPENDCHRIVLENSLALIKELTQAHEMLSESYDHLEKTKDELLAERSRLTEENERLRDIPKQLYKEMSERMVEERKIERKLAVRKMQTQIKALFALDDDVQGEIDQIAKEMVEGIE